MQTKISFVYIWEDQKPKDQRRYYVGSHKGYLEDGYVASSDTFLEAYQARPQDFVRYVVAECDDYESARRIEHEICELLDVKRNPEYYNLHNGTGDFWLKSHTKDARKRISEFQKGKKWSKESLEKRVQTRRARGHYQYTDEQREKFRQARLGKPRSPEACRKTTETLKKTWARRKAEMEMIHG